MNEGVGGADGDDAGDASGGGNVISGNNDMGLEVVDNGAGMTDEVKARIVDLRWLTALRHPAEVLGSRATDLIASVPERHTGNLRAGLHSFPLPVALEITVSLLWHPRMDADPAHRWLRGCVREACAEQRTGSSTRWCRPRR
mgnify:CR=1 FL=1